MSSRLILATLALACLAGCGGSDPADVTGSYSINITNRENGCNFDPWMEGESNSNIPVEITQDGGEASADVRGAAAVALELFLGSSVFEGDVSGNSLLLEITGVRSAQAGNCTYTFNAILDAELSDDNLTGDIRYTAATNDNSDCEELEGCITRQEFNGARPPQ